MKRIVELKERDFKDKDTYAETPQDLTIPMDSITTKSLECW